MLLPHVRVFFLLLVAAGSATGAEKVTVRDKTLVAWVAPANHTQRGGGVLSFEKKGGVFDSIVFGELAPGKWMAGSNYHHRTQREQGASPAETTDATTSVQVAIVYKGKQITMYRNGAKFADYAVKGIERFTDGDLVLMGLRHMGAAPEGRYFTGIIDDARIYAVALDGKQIAALKPDETSEPAPLAWWDFEGGRAQDRRGVFPVSTLIGGARIEKGQLHLDSEGAYVMATKAVPDGPHAALDLGSADSTARALREKLLSDPYRPGYHFVIPEGRAMPFDPNGAIFWKGRYHLFYIFQDKRGHNWGHVSSTDLFHWRHHPTGLVSGMFSGNAFINKEGRPTMCYHQVGQGNAMAVALDDELNAWEKLSTNPITPNTKPGDKHHGKYRSWDPYGWLEGDTYYAIFGGKRPAIAKCDSLGGDWEYAGDLLANTVGGISISEDVSCADFFTLGSKRMLLCISHRLGARYYLGEWKNEQFFPTFHERMSWADNSYFAPESLLDDRGRRIMWAWIFDKPGFGTRMDYGWSGTMSLPRVLWLGENGHLRMQVPKEIERLRYNGKKEGPFTLQADAERAINGVGGNSIELAIDMTTKDATQLGVAVCCSPDGEEQTRVFYDATDKRLKIDTSASSAEGGPKGTEAGPFSLTGNETLSLRVFVDKSVVEVFANDRQAVMRRIYPSREDSLGVRIFSRSGAAHVLRFEAWEMMPSSPY